MKLREYSASNIDLENETDVDGGIDIGESPKSIPPFNFAVLVNTIKRKAPLIGLTTGLAAILGLGASFFMKETYKGNFYLLVEPVSTAGKYTSPDAIARGETSDNNNAPSMDYPTNLVFLKSPGMSERIAQEITKKYPNKSFPKVWLDIRENLKVDRIGDTARDATKIFEVTYQGHDPEMVQKTLEASAEAFIKYSEEDRRTSIRSGIDFIDKQIPRLEKILTDLERQRQKIREDNNLIDPSLQGEQINKNLGSINAQITEAQISLNQSQILYNQLSQQLKFTPQEALVASNISEDPVYSTLLRQLKEVQTQLALVSADLTPGHPQIISLKAKEKNLKNLLKQRMGESLAQNYSPKSNNPSVLAFQGRQRMELISQLINADNKIQVSKNILKVLNNSKIGLEKQSKSIPAIINRYNQLDTDININKQVLNKLLVQKETLQVQGAQDLPWQIISKPQVPIGANGQPISEGSLLKKILPLSIFSGALLGLILAIALEKRKNVFQTAEDLKLTLDMPLLGEIPQLIEEDLENNNIVLKKPFEYLYSSIDILYRDPKVHSFVVRAIDDQDGQDLLALNLAKIAASTGRKVILVDADLENGKLHNELDLNNKIGLSEILTENKNLSEAIQKCKKYESLDFISCGNTRSWATNPLMSSKTNELIKELETIYDLVIYTPSVYYDLAEIGNLAYGTDGLLLAVRVAQTPESKVKQLVNHLRSQRLPVLGVVALEVPREEIQSSTFSSSPAPSQLVQANQYGSSNLPQDLPGSHKYK
jgi:uncharacterized protein involved in exopolysaccharide biosynthesis